MRAVVVAGRKPLYELGAADLVVRGLDELSFINLKQLFSDEESVEAHVSIFPGSSPSTFYAPCVEISEQCVGEIQMYRALFAS